MTEATGPVRFPVPMSWIVRRLGAAGAGERLSTPAAFMLMPLLHITLSGSPARIFNSSGCSLVYIWSSARDQDARGKGKLWIGILSTVPFGTATSRPYAMCPRRELLSSSGRNHEQCPQKSSSMARLRHD